MVESSDLPGAIRRTRAAERVQRLQNRQEELGRRRFPLEEADESAENQESAEDPTDSGRRRAVRDRWDRETKDGKAGPRPDAGPAAPKGPGDADTEEGGGGIDVRI